MSKSVLIICQHTPWGSSNSKETLDLILAGGAFDLPISLLFLDDAVWQLLQEQNPQAITQKNLTSNLQALTLFGIDEILVAEHSLQERRLTKAQLALPIQLIPKVQLSTLFSLYDIVITS